jgi:hypothetical protein
MLPACCISVDIAGLSIAAGTAKECKATILRQPLLNGKTIASTTPNAGLLMCTALHKCDGAETLPMRFVFVQAIV